MEPTLPLQSGKARRWLKRRLEVFDTLVDVEEAEELECALPFRFALIGNLDARLDAPEKIGAAGEEAFRSEPVADIAHHLVHAENLLATTTPGAGVVCGTAR